MVYKIDGSSHLNGVKGEDIVLLYFNNKSNYNFIASSINKSLNENKEFKEFNFIKKGGTQNRADIFCVNNNLSISIKSKKKENKKYRGTFDLINTSSINDFVCGNEKFKNLINEWVNWNNGMKNNNKHTYEEINIMVKDFYRSILNSINGKQIKIIFKKIKDLESNTIEVIRDYSQSIDEDIDNSALHFLKYHWFMDEFEKYIDKKQKINSNKTSSFIKTKDNKNSVFRIRIVLNNGVNALMRGLGMKPKTEGKNNNSQLTLKVQVDKVLDVVEKYDVNKIYKNKTNSYKDF